MTGSTHLLAGLVVGAAYANHLEPDAPLMVVGAASIGSMLPDIDISTSKLGRKVFPAALAIQVLFGHRNLFHTPFLYASLWAILSQTFPQFSLYLNACIMGIATHLFLDILNPAGIPLLYPVTNKRFHLASFHSIGVVDFALKFVLFFTFIHIFHETIYLI